MRCSIHPESNLAVFVFAIAVFARQGVLAESPQEMIQKQVPAAVKILNAYHNESPIPCKRTLHIVYWTPSDREPAPAYQERLSRVLLDIQAFYRSEMQRLGFGGRTLALDMEKEGLVRIHLVRGAAPYQQYAVESGNRIREECLPTLKKFGIQPESETIVLFCNMSNWDPDKRTIDQNSPYYAGGGVRGGTAWQVDSPILDAARLSEKSPLIRDRQYGEISTGRYNTIFVGGVCHELGHALGLPHNRQRPDEQKAFGTALMGNGNQTYREELRKEGRGSFLTLGEGLRLASHPLFSGSDKGRQLPVNAKLSDIRITLSKDAKSFTFEGTVTASPPVYAVVGYMDPAGGSDYDATTITAVPDANGKIMLACEALAKNKSGSLRLVACQVNGGDIGDQVLSVPYTVAADGVVDFGSYQAKLQLAKMIEAIQQRNPQAIDRELKRLQGETQNTATDKLVLRIATALASSMETKNRKEPSRVEANSCWLGDCQWKEAKVGWLKPLANRLPDESVVLSVAGQLCESGLYAHAPSSYKFDLGGKWNTLTGIAGLADGHDGSVRFVVLADGKTVWTSGQDAAVHSFKLDVSGVNEIVLVTEDSGDGNGGDWGVWGNVKLERN